MLIAWWLVTSSTTGKFAHTAVLALPSVSAALTSPLVVVVILIVTPESSLPLLGLNQLAPLATRVLTLYSFSGNLTAWAGTTNRDMIARTTKKAPRPVSTDHTTRRMESSWGLACRVWRPRGDYMGLRHDTDGC